MTWLLTMCLLTAIFTVGLTGKYKDEIIDIKEEKLKNDEEWQKKIFEVMSEYNEEILKLEKELSFYKKQF